MLVLLGSVGQVDRIRTIGIDDENLPVVVGVAFVRDFERKRF